MLRIKGYTINEILYRGEQFIIYRGKRDLDNQRIILKLCRLEQPTLKNIADLRHEYKVLKQFNVPDIINVYSLVQYHNQLGLVLEDINGKSLKDFLAKKPLDLSTFFKVALKIVYAIKNLHSKNLIHKDINSNNIIINPQTLEVKLTDFGISSELSQETQEFMSLKNIEGTLAYISPEQTGRMNRAIDFRSDFYSLGVTFFEMLTGQLPFQGEDAMEMIYAHLATIPPSITSLNSNVPPILASIIAKLLAKIPEDRYASAESIRQDLLQCQTEWEKDHYIKNFPLAQNDTQDHLIFPQKRYGREKDIIELMAIFKKISMGKKALLFISGSSGIGKTTLAKDIQKPVVLKQGYFVSGKYELLQRASPYRGIIEAIQELIRRLLTESEEQLIVIRDLLLSALRNNGKLMIDMIPNLELIIGPQPILPSLNATEEQNRFMVTFQNFVRVLAQPNHPLVIYLDDLQWVDNASLELLRLLLTDDELKYFLIIGAYRDNAVNEYDPLMLFKKEMQSQTIVRELKLHPLSMTDISAMLADMLNSSREKVSSLANLLLHKTRGNPFYVHEFLKQIHHEKFLTFDVANREWDWDLKKIEQLQITDNVVDLLTKHIHDLSPTAQKLIKLAACIGYVFDLATLKIISNEPSENIASAILELSQATLITPLQGNIRILEAIENKSIAPVLSKEMTFHFTHDRIQHRAYELIPDETRQSALLRIGRLLIKKNRINKEDDMLFSLLTYFNNSIALITSAKEQKKIAKYNYWAGIKAKSSLAYCAAKTYFQTGMTLLAGPGFQANHKLYFNLMKELANCYFLTAEFEKAQNLFNDLLSMPLSLAEKIGVHILNCEMLTSLNHHDEAIALGLKGLASVGIYLPENPSSSKVLWAILKIKLLTMRRPIGKLKLQAMSSVLNHAIANLIDQLINSAYLINSNLFILLILKNLQLNLKNGYTDSTSYSFLTYAFILMHGFNRYKEAISYTEISEKFEEEHPAVKFAAKNSSILGNFIDPWRFPLPVSINTMQNGYRLALELGQWVPANYCIQGIMLTSFMMGKPLSDVKAAAKNALTFINKTNTTNFSEITNFVEYVIHCLMSDAFNFEKLEAYEKKIIDHNNKTVISLYYSEAIKLLYILNFFKEAQKLITKFEAHTKHTLGSTPLFEGYFYSGLAMLAAPDKKSGSFMHKIKSIQTKLKRWATWCPINYEAYLALFDGEIARLNGQTSLAMRLYHKAIELAQSQHALHLIAIANECCGKFYLQMSFDEIAKTYLEHAHYAYQRWGANTKSLMLERQFPEWFQTELVAPKTTMLSSTNTSSGTLSIDTISLMKSTLAISEEIQLDKLLKKLLVLLLQNTGAKHGTLITKDYDHWYIAVQGTTSAQKITLTPTAFLSNNDDLPLALIRYVQRTQEPLLIKSSKDYESLLAEDAYLARVKPQSIMILPISYQGQLQSILYLENKMTSYAFNLHHIHVLQILSSQAAISLQNARLYYQATHDPLTGLGNRNLLYQLFDNAIIQAQKIRSQIAILFFDLDNFKNINDTLGHDIGDLLLIYFADLLKRTLHENFPPVRLGGDEFVAMIVTTEEKQIHQIAQALLESIQTPVSLQNHKIKIGTSIGISVYPDNGDTIAELLKKADIALYQAKAHGKGHFEFFK